MQQLKQALIGGAADFGGLIVFYGLLYTLGLKAAIAGTIVFLAIDAVRRWRFKLGFPRIYIISGALAVGFGVIDLASNSPFMLQYEGVISNLVIAGMFAYGARGKSMLQELVEQREGEPFEDRADITRFFQLLTLLWAVYFALKAVIYLWMAQTMTMERALAIRPFIGNGSLVLMVVAMTQGRRLFLLFRRVGLLPRVEGAEVF